MAEPESQPAPNDAGGVAFSQLVLMFSTTALVHLGMVPDPAGGAKTIDLAQAKQAIDILEVLKDKTSGNLSTGESRLLEDLLFDLHLHYVEAIKRAGVPQA